MDGAKFDHLSRRVAQPSTRRTVFALAAFIGLGPLLAAAGKKRRNPCKGGCGPCRVCRRRGRKKRCVPAPEGSPCAGGTCRAGACCVPDTCASLGLTCGPATDGCGRALACGTCGTGTTASCNGGTCATCAATCSATCRRCFHRPDGSTVCGNPVSSSCARICATDADCLPEQPLCVAASTDLVTNVTTPASCAPPGSGECAAFTPC